MEYYLARLHCSQEIRGKNKDFTNLRNTWQISILADRRLYRDKELVHRFEYYDRRNGTVLGGRTAVVTLELRKLSQIESKPVRKMTSLERWASFFRFGTDKAKRPLINGILEAEEEIALAGKVMQRFTKKEQEFFDNISREKYQVDMNAKRRRERERAKRADERAEKRIVAKIHAEGQAEARMEMARKLKAMGISVKKIAAVTDLSPEQIKGL
jgi:predicted transposase/invertase (TIGR01784 family)